MRFHSALMSWDQVTTDFGGGPLTGLSGYRIYAGQNPLVLTLYVDVGLTATPLTPSYLIATLPSYGTWYFNVTAYDPSNNESPHLSTFSKEIVDDGPTGGFSC